MFESLKKKFSRTSEKLEEELIEEAEKEDNLQEESGKRFSFFSFGRKKEEKEEEKEDESDLLPETTEEVVSEPAVSEDAGEEKEEKKSRFWSRSKSKDDDVEESEDEAEAAVEEAEVEVKEEKSHFWSRSKSKDDDVEESEDEAEAVVEEAEVEVKEEKSRFWSRSKSKDDDVEESEDEAEEDVKEEKSHFWSRSKSKDDDVEGSEDEAEEDAKEEKSHFWSRSKSKDKDVSADGEATGGLFSFVREKTISEKHVEDILWELEMELLQGDVAMEVANAVVESVKDDLVGKKIKRSNDITEYTFIALRNAVAEIIDIPGKSMTEMIEEKKAQGEPLVVMFVGINGTGKTTTIGKLANYYLKKGYTPVIAASDTFRAGAIEQVTYHADNVGVKIIKHKKGSDPAAVAFDAVEHAKAQGKELVLIDTAGRMQTNVNLMDEMKKIKRVANPDLVVFVGDALTGNDATEQAVKFNDAIDIDGVILTKADADSKGGASLSIGYVIKKPIMFLGVGQGYDDIKEYDAEWMLDQLFSESEEAEAIEA
ncbi:signal recognition particle-docking protein FtsY [uncultured Methanobrevibacter sp.]|uniref:signal recognition particle-docking protein FtsY n=1 Tax=uncultured Methanobrevibacter sp. TaxID=253161 RepID=UPI00374487A3